MIKLLKNIKNVFLKAFASKKIVIISDHKMREFNIPGSIQLFLFALIIGSAAWFPYSAGKFAAYEEKTNHELVLIESYDNVEYRVQQIEKNLSTMEQYLKALNSTGVDVKSKDPINNKDKGSNLKLDYKDKISYLEDKQYKMVAYFHNKTISKIDTLEKIMSRLQVDYSDAAISAGININNVGGPYIPIDSNEEAKEYFIGEEFVENFKYLYYLKKMVSLLPVSSPLDNPRITSRYGSRRDPFTGRRAMHSGIDMVSDIDPSVYATAPGVVIEAKRNGAYGKIVKIKHKDGFETRYAHLKLINVYKGQKIKRGDVIGIQGNTGRSTGTHLHYEVRKNGKHINPAKFLQQAHKLTFTRNR